VSFHTSPLEDGDPVSAKFRGVVSALVWATGVDNKRSGNLPGEKSP